MWLEGVAEGVGVLLEIFDCVGWKVLRRVLSRVPLVVLADVKVTIGGHPCRE